MALKELKGPSERLELVSQRGSKAQIMSNLSHSAAFGAIGKDSTESKSGERKVLPRLFVPSSILLGYNKATICNGPTQDELPRVPF